MATVYDIETALEMILEAQYGKDVRQAIRDAIHACFDEGGSGSIDLSAREGIQNLTLEVEAALAEMNLHSGRTKLLDDVTIATANSTLTLPKPFSDFDSVWVHLRAYPVTNNTFQLIIGNGYVVEVPVPHWANYTGATDIIFSNITSQTATLKFISCPLYADIGTDATQAELFSIDEFPLPMYDNETNQHELDMTTRLFKITNATGAHVDVVGYGMKSSDSGTATGLVRDSDGIVHFV